MTIKERIQDVLDHFDYTIIKTKGYDYDNVLVIDNASPTQVKRYLYIVYGDRIEKVRGGFKIRREK